jgi:hypothetical protein
MASSIVLQQPDIEYHPDEAKYHARSARLLAENPDLGGREANGAGLSSLPFSFL